MSRELNLLPIPRNEMQIRNRARLGAAGLLVVFFSALVAFAPQADSPEARRVNVTAVTDVEAGLAAIVNEKAR